VALTLYFHPLSSFCHKVLIALYENETPFTPRVIDLGDAADRAELLAMWPIGKFPVLRDEGKNEVVAESSIIIEYLGRHHPGSVTLVPSDGEAARRVRFADRFYDLYVHEPMQKIVGDRLRPKESKDPLGVEQAKARLKTAYGMIEKDMAGRTWAAGEDYSMADCAASPALFYANKVVPFGGEHKNVAAYFNRLLERRSYKRALEEAKPYFHLFPQE